MAVAGGGGGLGAVAAAAAGLRRRWWLLLPLHLPLLLLRNISGCGFLLLAVVSGNLWLNITASLSAD